MATAILVDGAFFPRRFKHCLPDHNRDDPRSVAHGLGMIDTKQKGVDMRLGLDVASLAFKGQVDQIVIVAADADYVPAAKLARREGIDVILDRMGDHRAAKDLIQHIDAIRDCFLPHPESKKN